MLGRALLSWGLVQRHDLMACAEDVRRLFSQGRPTTLGQILLQRGFLSLDHYQAILTRLRQVNMQSGAAPHMQHAVAQLPNMHPSGAYTQTYNPTHLDESVVERAVQNWQTTSRDITASGSDIDVAAMRAASQASAGAPPREPTGPDRAIRKKLKIPAGQVRFPIGAWMIDEYIDAGNWGIVYRVSRQTGDRTPYALKILKKIDPSEEIRQRFIQEARTMRKLRHRGIVHVHDAGVVEGLLWFVMDYLDGPDLKGVLEERGTLPVGEALRIVKRICSAVSYAHSQKIYHRDIKPENVILAGGSDPVLTDFGLAKDDDSALNLTVEGQRIGTPLYMAPELLLDAAGASQQSEVYSLGAMLYQCLTGHVPFEAKSIVDLINKIEEGKFPPLKTACPDAPKKLAKICERTLNKDPKKRPQTVHDLAIELTKCQ